MTLTPLIDVVFILLVFFMLVTSFADERRLALAATSRAPGTDQGTITTSHIVVGATTLHLGDRLVPLGTLVADVATQARADPMHRVFVRPDAEASLQRLVDVLAALRGEGVEHIDVATP